MSSLSYRGSLHLLFSRLPNRAAPKHFVPLITLQLFSSTPTGNQLLSTYCKWIDVYSLEKLG